MVDRRMLEVWKYGVAALAGAVVVMGVSRALFAGPSAMGTSQVMIPTLAALAAMGWCYFMAVLALKRVDEYQVAAGKFAWYWGGSLGVAVSLVVYTFIHMGGLHWLEPARFQLSPEVSAGFRMGYLVGVGFPFAGFLMARLYWGLAKR